MLTQKLGRFPHLVFLDAEEDVTLALPPLPPLLFLPDDLAAAAALFLAIAEICRESGRGYRWRIRFYAENKIIS